MISICSSSLGHWYGKAFFFATRTCAACWTALWHLDLLCYEPMRDVKDMG